MANSAFFDQSSEQSAVKSAIVSKYFLAWANVILKAVRKSREKRLAYIDLFAGPGRYKDGSRSTPLLILEMALAHPELREMLVTLFNDANGDYSRSLEESISALPGIEGLKYKPRVMNDEVGDNLVKKFEEMNFVPTLFFVDPWGYKGLSLRLINAVLKDWACECVVFFNYNRIRMGLNNPIVTRHMNALFGEERADALRSRLVGLSPSEAELAIVDEMSQALGAMSGSRFVLPFRFRDARGTRTSHHLIFVSKHQLGYKIMKDVMARESSAENQGVPTFCYNPADARFPVLFELDRPLDDLADRLLTDFAGQTTNAKDLFESHHVGKPYIERNYKDALRKLEEENRIRVVPSERRIQNGVKTFGPKAQITFPSLRTRR